MDGQGRPRDDDTVVLSGSALPLAYVFWLTGTRRGNHAALRPEGTTIGGGNQVDVGVDDQGLAAEHATIRLEGDTWYLYDVASSGRTKVAGVVVHRHALDDGDRITLGETELAFRVLK
jgi:pSer/pThr/pTyr-binding forkhead associated (FHA) protein